LYISPLTARMVFPSSETNGWAPESTNPQSVSHVAPAPLAHLGLTNTDDRQSLVTQDGLLADVRSTPIRSSVSKLLGHGDASRSERCEIALVVVRAEDATHGCS
jgi:hypothetical protein